MLGVRVLVAREEHKRIRERMVGTRKLLHDRGHYAEGVAFVSLMTAAAPHAVRDRHRQRLRLARTETVMRVVPSGHRRRDERCESTRVGGET
jgi:hypothetical protein